MSTNALATPPNDNLLVIRNCFMLLVGNNLLAAACLNQISYWNMKMGRDIWKTDDEFSEELHMSIHQFRRMKSKYLRDLPFLKITLKGIPATCHYEIDFDILNEMIANQSAGIPAEIEAKSHAAKPLDNQRLRKSEHHDLRKNTQPNTETILSKITKNQTTVVGDNEKKITTNEPQPVKLTNQEITRIHVDVSMFKDHEQIAAQKLLASIKRSDQIAVIAVMSLVISSNQITKSNIGYLSAVIRSITNGTFTPVDNNPNSYPKSASGGKKQTLDQFVLANPSKTIGKTEQEVLRMMNLGNQ